MWSQEKVLRVAFLVGAITDALAILPMLIPPLAKLLWGFEDVSGAYQFAMGYGASLMLGWTALYDKIDAANVYPYNGNYSLTTTSDSCIICSIKKRGGTDYAARVPYRVCPISYSEIQHG